MEWILKMADFWIKVEKGTPDKPEILEMASILNISDPDTVTGKLIRVWSWFDSNSENGHAPSVTNVLIDRMTGVTGFTDSLVTVGWLTLSEDGSYMMSNFDRHIGKGAKKRALDAERKRKSRQSSAECHSQSVTKNGTETGLDKSRVDKSRSTTGAKPRTRFAEPDVESVFQYMSERGFSNLQEADRFVDFYASKGWMVGKNKMKDWKAAVRNWMKDKQPQQQRQLPRGFGE